MADAYVITGEQNVVGTDITALVCSQPVAALKRAKVYYVGASEEGTPADFMQGIQFTRTTAAGTDTAVTPNPLDPAAGASSLTACGENHTVEPTYTANSELFDQAIHMRSLLQYHARNPWVIPVTNDNGIGALLALDGSRTDLWKVQMEWEE